MFAYPLGLGSADLVTLTDAPTITLDLAAGRHFRVTLAGNRTLANPLNQTSGAGGVLIIRQDATGNRTLSFGTHYKFLGNITPTLEPTPNSRTFLSYLVEEPGYVVIYRWGTL